MLDLDSLPSNFPELRFILDILGKQPNLDKLQPEFLQQINWDYLLKLTVRHRLVDQVYTFCTGLSIIPEDFLQRLRGLNQTKEISMLMITAETIRICRCLDEAGLIYAVVKGVPLAVDVYGGPTKRQCKDINLWVEPHDLPLAKAILESHGYILVRPEYCLEGFKKDYYFTNNHDLGFYNSQRKIEVELHFRLEYFGTDFFKLNEVSLTQVKFNHNSIKTLAAEYNVLYLIIHGAIHAWSRLRWLHDIVLYIQQQKCDLIVLLELARSRNCQHIVLQTLWLIQKLYGFETPSMKQILAQIDKKSLRLARLGYQFIVADYELTGGEGVFNRMFFVYRWYLSNLALPGKKLAAVIGDLFKIDKVFADIDFSYHFRFAYYLCYPFWVIKYIFKRKF